MTTTKDSPNLHLEFVEIVAPRLWMSTTYKNTYVGNSAPAAALNVLAPLTGWYDCGSIKAVTVPVTKTVRELVRGIPQTARKLWETGRSAQITFNTNDLTPYVEALINGQTIYNTLTGSAYNVASLRESDAEARSVTRLASTPTLAVNDIVVCGSITNTNASTNFNIAVVESMTGSILTLGGAGFPVKPAIEDHVQKITRIAFKDTMGTNTVRSAMLFWDDIVDSSGDIQAQHCMYFPKLQNYTGQNLDFKSETEEYESSITLAAQAVNMIFDDGRTGYGLYKKWLLAY